MELIQAIKILKFKKAEQSLLREDDIATAIQEGIEALKEKLARQKAGE